jgi:hypothetical protein
MQRLSPMLSDWNWVHRFRVSGSMAKKAGFVTKSERGNLHG